MAVLTLKMMLFGFGFLSMAQLQCAGRVKAKASLDVEASQESGAFLKCEQLCYATDSTGCTQASVQNTVWQGIKDIFRWNESTTPVKDQLVNLFDLGGGAKDAWDEVHWFCMGGTCVPPAETPGYCVAQKVPDQEVSEVHKRVYLEFLENMDRESPDSPVPEPIKKMLKKMPDSPKGSSIDDVYERMLDEMDSWQPLEVDSEKVEPGAVVKASDGRVMMITHEKIGDKGKFVAKLGEDGQGGEVDKVDASEVEVDTKKTAQLKDTADGLIAAVVKACSIYPYRTSARERCCLFEDEGCKKKVSRLWPKAVAKCVKACSTFGK